MELVGGDYRNNNALSKKTDVTDVWAKISNIMIT